MTDFDGTSRSPNLSHADQDPDRADDTRDPNVRDVRDVRDVTDSAKPHSLKPRAQTLQSGVGSLQAEEARMALAIEKARQQAAQTRQQPIELSLPVSQVTPAESGRAPASGYGSDPALADTQQQSTRPSHRAARNAKMGRTLRMELKLGPVPAPGDVAAEPYFGGADPRDPNGDNPNGPRPLVFGATQRVGENRSGEYVSGRPALAGTNPMGAMLANFEPGRGYVGSAGTMPGQSPQSRAHAQAHAHDEHNERPVVTQTPRRRELRPGERTVILKRRRTPLKDWAFVIALVAALGVTASMFLSSQSENAEIIEEASTAEANAAADPNGAHIANAANTPRPQPTPQAAPAIQATELRSEPAGAEVAVQGAVIGNTPVRVARAETSVDYTLRFPGYESQVVRVGSQSPASIAVTLRRTGQPQ